MRVARQVGAAVVAVTAAVAPSAPAAFAAAPPLFFQAQTTASAVHLTVTQEPASSIVTAGLVDDAAAYAAATFSTGSGSAAQGAAAFPGTLVVQGPGLLCTMVLPCPVQPPAYPLLADASYPRTPKASAGSTQTVGSGPFVVQPLGSTATAGSAGNGAQTRAGAVSLLGGSPVAVSVGASTAATQVATTATSMTVSVRSRASDITIGSLLHIGSVVTTDDVVLTRGKPPVDHPHVTVAGVTVAGQAATIDDNGVHVSGVEGPAVQRRLAQQGVSVQTVGVVRSDSATAARSTATGVRIDFSVPVKGLPYIPNPLPAPFDQIPGVDANGTYVGTITLGAAGAAAGASRQPLFGLGSGVVPTATTPPKNTPAAARNTPAAARLPGGATSGLGAGPAPAVASGGGTSAPLLRLVGWDTSTLYAVLALGAVGLFVGWRGWVLLRRASTLSARLAGWRRA